MFRICRLRDDLLDLFAAQNRREFLPLARRRDGERRTVALQRDVTKNRSPFATTLQVLHDRCRSRSRWTRYACTSSSEIPSGGRR